MLAVRAEEPRGLLICLALWASCGGGLPEPQDAGAVGVDWFLEVQ
jgi:hypothetical protein